jgi:hypothetical protein
MAYGAGEERHQNFLFLKINWLCYLKKRIAEIK